MNHGQADQQNANRITFHYHQAMPYHGRRALDLGYGSVLVTMGGPSLAQCWRACDLARCLSGGGIPREEQEGAEAGPCEIANLLVFNQIVFHTSTPHY